MIEQDHESVLFLNNSSVIGGVELLISAIVPYLDRNRYRVFYGLPPFPGCEEHVAPLEEQGVTWVPLNLLAKPASSSTSAPPSSPVTTPAPSLKASLIQIWKKIIPERIDSLIYHHRDTRQTKAKFIRMLSSIGTQPGICHLIAGNYDWMAGADAACRELFPRARRVIHMANPPVFSTPTGLERRMYRDAHAVIFVSEQTRGAWKKKLGSIPMRDTVLPEPIEMGHIPFTEREAIDKHTWSLCTIGRLSPVKALDVAIRSLKEVRASGLDARLTIMGTGPEEEHLRKLTAELGVNEFIDFAGFVSGPEKHFDDIDILLQPSLSEGMPISVLQAMAAGLPVIATDVGGLPELIRHEETGLMIPAPPKVDDLTAAICRLLSDHALRRHISSEASAFVRSRFEAGKAVAELTDLYASIL
ncbi:MAG: glycosyltransferase family 4 protein [Verrucomicrobia bacterium]|nr:glycosyltransferase family 4 protein [Verrucomicrobiota bacterium]